VETLRQDVRYAARSFRRAPAFTAVVLVILVLGGGLNSAVFSVVNETLLRPLPYKDPKRLVFVSESHPRRGSRGALRPANFFDWRARNDVFEDATAFSDAQMELTGSGDPERLLAQRVLEGFFPLLGVEALVGRRFEPMDYGAAPSGGATAGTGAADVVVLSYGFWQRRFAGDRRAIGQTLRLNGKLFAVVGVMPDAFQGLGGGHQLWLPWVLTPEERADRQTHQFYALARTKRDVSLEQASAQMTLLYRQLEQQYPAENRDWRVEVTPWRDVVLGETRRVLLVLLGATALVLVIATANVAGLILARAVDREKEMAIRLALGASWTRILRQLLTEGLLLAGLSASLSLLAGLATLRLFVGLGLLAAIPFDFHPHLDARVFCVTSGISLLIGLLLGLTPALQASKIDLVAGIGGGQLPSRHKLRIRHLLVLGQMAVGFVLLIAGGLMLKSFLRLHQVALGFDPRNLLAVQLSLPESRYSTDREVRLFVPRVLEEIGSIPGVLAAASASDLPLTRLTLNLRFVIEGRPPTGQDEWSAEGLSVSPAFFSALRATIARGRPLSERDTFEAPGAVVVDETLAREYWPGEDPLGKRIQFPYPDLGHRWFSVVGIVPGVKYESPAARAERTLYLPEAQMPFRDFFLLIRTVAMPLDMVHALKDRIKGIDPDLPLGTVNTMEQVANTSFGEARLRTRLLGLFAGLALVLSSAGLYGLLAYSVARRTREMGIRRTLGAETTEVLKLVMGEGLALTVMGMGLGLCLAIVLTRFLGNLLFEVGPFDPSTYALVAALLASVAAVASYLPARRAAMVEPAVALRRE
jgi:putative ABC transport system permease protein